MSARPLPPFSLEPTLADIEREEQTIAWLRAELAGETIADDCGFERREEQTIANLAAHLEENRKPSPNVSPAPNVVRVEIGVIVSIDAWPEPREVAEVRFYDNGRAEIIETEDGCYRRYLYASQVGILRAA
jgi:hypothetical protein